MHQSSPDVILYKHFEMFQVPPLVILPLQTKGAFLPYLFLSPAYNDVVLLPFIMSYAPSLEHESVGNVIDRMKVAVYLLFLVAVVVSGAPRAAVPGGRIIQGTPAPLPDASTGSIFPYVVSITENGNHFCGGFIYNSKFVVTSASCMEGKTIGLLEVVAGQYNLIEDEGTEQNIPVFKVTPFDSYVPENKTHDIALIELSEDFDLTKPGTVNYIPFNEVFTDKVSSPNGYIMGWGATVLGGGVSPRLRYTTAVMTETSNECSPGYTQDDFGVATMICGNPVYEIPDNVDSITSSSPCTFDGGSPLVQDRNEGADPSAGAPDYIVVGVLSKYSPTCDKATPSVYTRLSVYYAWLNRVAGAQPK